MNLLLTEAIRFLEDSFAPSFSWITSPIEAELLRKKPPEIVKQLTLEKREDPLLFSQEKEMAKPIIQGSSLGVQDLSNAIKNLFPEFSTKTTPPEEKEFFQEISYKKALKAHVVLFSFREGKSSDLFLQNISRALQVYCPSSAIIDMKKWEHALSNCAPFFQEAEACLFIASQALYKKPQLLPFLKENPASSERFLGKGKFFLLPPFETYFNDPMQKKELWNTLCNLLSSPALSQASS